METETAIPPARTDESGSGSAGKAPPAGTARPRRPWWPWAWAILGVGALLVAGAAVQRAIDRENASRDLYGTQLLTTVSRYGDAAAGQLALPVAQRNAAAVFDDLADSIASDQGVNGAGTLSVTTGAGSAATPSQVVFSVTVESRYASTTAVVWDVRVPAPGAASDARGACVLSSTLLGTGPATTGLYFGSSGLQACSPSWWSASADPAAPRFDLAGVQRSPAA